MSTDQYCIFGASCLQCQPISYVFFWHKLDVHISVRYYNWCELSGIIQFPLRMPTYILAILQKLDRYLYNWCNIFGIIQFPLRMPTDILAIWHKLARYLHDTS